MKELEWEPILTNNIKELSPYVPGKSAEEIERDYEIKEVIKLASNENPLGPSPLAIHAIKMASHNIHLYPDAQHFKMKHALAQKYHCQEDEFSLGNGSTELIDLLIRIFTSNERNVVTQENAFIAYKLFSKLHGSPFIETPIDENFKVDIEKLISHTNKNTALVFLANPNNPTGRVLHRDEIKLLATKLEEKKILLVLDYAYWEYVDDVNVPNPIDIYKEHPNVIILMTLSKAYGLAGLRIGHALARPSLTKIMESARQPFNISSLALEGGVAALGDTEHLKKSILLNRESKLMLENEFKKIGFKTVPSQGNFLLVNFERNIQEIYINLLKKGIIIRPLSYDKLKTYFRISCGTIEQNLKLINTINELL